MKCSRQNRWIVATSLLVALSPAARAADVSQATNIQTTFVEPPRPARSLQAMLASSGVVIVGSVSDVGPLFLRGGSAVYRRYRVIVEEVIKDPKGLTAGGLVVVVEPGGTIRQSEVEYRTHYRSEPFQVGDRVVLFLEHAPFRGEDLFEVLVLGGSSLRVTDTATGTVAVRDLVSRLPELAGQKVTTINEIVSRLKSYR